MKLTKFTNLLVLGLVLTVVVAGCRKRPVGVTNLPYGREYDVADAGKASKIDTTDKVDQSKIPSDTDKDKFGNMPVTDPDVRKNWVRDPEPLRAFTVHFDFDSSVVKAAEKPNVAAVADKLKASPLDALEIDGHCDERGTEEYNRALGERRALALREELIRLGIEASRVDTTSYGKDRPADPGHDEAAWKKNRRGEFLLELHPNK